ncbi:hypothetical protein T439DRAFT_379559 [Meredithblackwellia eburnea MCA 4105]
MAPKAKPRGLKASAKAAPATLTPPTSQAAAPPPTEDEGTERTFPLDEDALTISDLFELRFNTQNILNNPKVTADQQDEARGLLRGILHGGEPLLQFFASTRTGASTSAFFTYPHPPMTSEGQEDRLNALGLSHPAAPSHLAYLQAFAVHELSAIVPPPPSAARNALTEGSAKKKRKIDVREPTTAAEWLEEALPRYEVAFDWVHDAELKDGAENSHWLALLWSDWAKGKCDAAVIEFLAGKEKKGAKTLEGVSEMLVNAAGALTQYRKERSHSEASGIREKEDQEWELERGDPSASLLRSLGAYLAVCDGFLGQDGLVDVQAIKNISDTVDFSLITLNDKSDEAEKKRDLDVHLLRAEAYLAEFILLAEAIEDKYRPTNDDEDEDEEGDVIPLPEENDVKEARLSGRKTISKIEAALSLINDGTTGSDSVTLKSQQYGKLEEALLTLSALINPDDERGTHELEDELARVRKEGGLGEEEDGEGGAPEE